ncbi:MAG: FecR domain-containing protein, partial [Odoribacteraceae bacterium]|nr:FecR domain-containing protein [Odoribacteraceae bacterium]
MGDENLDIQLLDYITGHLSDAEQARVRARIEGDESHRAYYEQFQVSYLQQRWYFREQLIREKKARRYRRRRIRATRYAALLAASIALFFGARAYRVAVLDREEKVVTTSKEIVPGTLKAKLMVDAGHVISLGDRTLDMIEIDGGGQISVKIPGNIDYRGNETKVSRARNHVLIIEKGGEYTVTLEDGSIVQLNSASTLSYPVVFTGDERRVRLSGEAYFRVTPGKDAPFIVEVEDLCIRVTGTEFNVNTHKKN